jgi:hypothetical protein
MTSGRKGHPKDLELLELSFAEIKSGRASIKF